MVNMKMVNVLKMESINIKDWLYEAFLKYSKSSIYLEIVDMNNLKLIFQL